VLQHGGGGVWYAYSIALADLDLKPMEKFPTWAGHDEDINRHFVSCGFMQRCLLGIGPH
jgi:hypothetical protein